MPTCSSCSQSAPDEAVTCPSCGQPLRSPCPFCGELILIQAVKCKFCKERLVEESIVNPAELARIRNEVAELVKAADEPTDTAQQPGKIGRETAVALASFAGSVGLTFAASFVPEERAAGFIGLGVILNLVLFFVFAAVLGADLSIPAVRGRKTGLKAVQCYFSAIRHRRWNRAFACLSPIARSNPAVDIPVIAGLNSPAPPVTLSSPSQLKAYWKNLVHTSSFGWTARWMSRLTVEPRDGIDENIERYHDTMKTETYPLWVIFFVLVSCLIGLILYVLLRRSHTLEFDVVTVRHRSQWWILTGEAGSAIDRELA